MTIADGALYPGAAVQKELPPVGDIHITGIVNIAGVLEQLTLQTTRLSTVISLADTITQGIVNYTNSFDLFVDAFCIKTIFLKKSCGRTGFSEYIIYTDTFYRYRCFLRQAFAYCSAKSADY